MATCTITPPKVQKKRKYCTVPKETALACRFLSSQAVVIELDVRLNERKQWKVSEQLDCDSHSNGGSGTESPMLQSFNELFSLICTHITLFPVIPSSEFLLQWHMQGQRCVDKWAVNAGTFDMLIYL